MRIYNMITGILAVMALAAYGKGYFFLNTLTGAEATGIFTGKIPPSVTVEEREKNVCFTPCFVPLR